MLSWIYVNPTLHWFGRDVHCVAKVHKFAVYPVAVRPSLSRKQLKHIDESAMINPVIVTHMVVQFKINCSFTPIVAHTVLGAQFWYLRKYIGMQFKRPYLVSIDPHSWRDIWRCIW